ncbi:MAG: thioredoxin domain-containing protein [Thermoplasmata archaeon]
MKSEENFGRSPYLEEHKNDLVKWNLWSDSLFDMAKKVDKPLFITIGYSTCHWCHVIQKESFRDEEISRIINENYIPVVIDREERPDIDSFYMHVSQIMNGNGGWPLNVIAMPDGRPFQVFTYLPARGTDGNGGMEGILKAISEIWKSERGRIIEAADQVSSITLAPEKEGEGDIRFEDSVEILQNMYDRRNGGFGDQPKFPNFPYIMFLLKYMNSKKIKSLSYLIEKTLRNMRNGGIYDQVGYGLHRYSTDSEWKIPHFEKMLYDQAMAIQAYTQYYRFSGDFSFLEVAGEIVEFVNREMKNPDGFYDSGLDADFKGSEGSYYTWTDEELKEKFDDETRKRIEESYYFDRDMENRIVLRRRELFNVSRDKIRGLRELNSVILNARNERGSPNKDDKAILAWNAMLLSSMISYSISMQMKGIDDLVETSRRMMKSFSSGGKLYRTVRNGSKGVTALLEDYAYYISLMIDLYEVTGDKEFLSETLERMKEVKEKFLDKMEGGFYSSPEGELKTIMRNKDRLDIIYPSGESVLYDVLEKLYIITGAEEFREFAESIMHSRRNEMLRNPLSSVFLLSAMISKGKETKVEVPENMRKEFLSEIGQKYLPNAIVVPGLESIQVCDDKSCQFKGNDLKEAIEFLSK